MQDDLPGPDLCPRAPGEADRAATAPRRRGALRARAQVPQGGPYLGVVLGVPVAHFGDGPANRRSAAQATSTKNAWPAPIARACAAARFHQHVSAHTLRHSFATTCCRRTSHCAGAAGPRREHDDDLHARAQGGSRRHRQSAGFTTRAVYGSALPMALDDAVSWQRLDQLDHPLPHRSIRQPTLLRARRRPCWRRLVAGVMAVTAGWPATYLRKNWGQATH